MSPEAGAIGGTEWKRKAVHVGSGGLALFLHWLEPWNAWMPAAAALLLNLFILPRLTGKALEREPERRQGKAWGILFYPLSVLILTVVFANRLEIAAAGWALMAFGDGSATLFGKSLPRPRLPWNHGKSMAGSLALVAFGTLPAWALYLFVAAGHGRHPDPFLAMVAVGATVVLAALLESLPTGLDDNLLVPLAGGVCLYGLTLAEPVLLAPQVEDWILNFILGLMVNLVFGLLAWRARSVDASGFMAGLVVGTFIFTFGGWRGYLMLIGFFVVGSVTTKIGYAGKAAAGIAQEKGGARGAKNALANCGTGLFLILLAAITPHGTWMAVAFTAAFATAAFDTVSSEIGQVYGRRTVLITSLRPVPPGTDGAISLEGTLAGLLAALVLGALGVATGFIPYPALVPVAVGAFVGAMGESYLGASLESIKLIDNEMVNFLNTVVGAGVALALAAALL
jgi:uncharacterized protein (TIGR00297 family)